MSRALENIFTTATQVTDTGDTLVTKPFSSPLSKGGDTLVFDNQLLSQTKTNNHTYVARLCPPLSVS